MKAAICFLAIIALSGVLGAQEFEVASVRMFDPRGRAERIEEYVAACSSSATGRKGGPGTADPERVSYQCENLSRLVMEAFGQESFRHTYLFPGLSELVPPDVVLTMAAVVKPGATMEDYRTMLLHFLEQRFHLRVHKEMRESSVYKMRVAKEGLRMNLNTANPPNESTTLNLRAAKKDEEGFPIVRPIPGRILSFQGKSGSRMIGSNIPLSELADRISMDLKAPVTLDAALEGKYDFQFDYTPGYMSLSVEPSSIINYPPLLEALKKQLGLELAKSKGQVEFVIVDALDQKPTEN